MSKHNDFTGTDNPTREIADSHHETSSIYPFVDSSIETEIRAIAERSARFFNVLSTPDAFSSQNRALLDSQSQMETTMKTIAKSANKFESIKSSLPKESKLDTLSSLNRAINKANSPMMSFIQDLKRQEEMMKRATTNIAPMIRVALAAQSQIEGAIPFLRTQLKQLKLQPHLSGIAIDSDVPLQKSPYRNANKSITNDNEVLNPIDRQPPTHEVFRETDLPRRTRVPAIPEGRSIEELLREINPNWLNLLQGAREALNTNNPDRARHVAVSLRELLGHVLRQLTPDDDIRDWNTNPDYYDDKDKPTRKARLRYIYREINSGSLSELVDADVTSILTLITRLNRGTHGVAPCLTHRELQVVVDYVESRLLFLLRVNSSNKS